MKPSSTAQIDARALMRGHRWTPLFGLCFTLLFGLSCRPHRPLPPACKRLPGASDDAVGNAGCLIVVGDGALLVQTRERPGYTVPGGTAESGESAACTAARETWEETGIGVRVGPLLLRHDNGFHIFACEARAPIDPSQLTIPSWARDEIRWLGVVDPTTVQAAASRYPEYWDQVVASFKTLRATQPVDR